jgi:hypothetical protein
LRRENIVDFFVVEPEQIGIHERLCNWAMWCKPPARREVLPMFRFFRSSAKARAEHGTTPRPSVDTRDALRMHDAVKCLPERHRASLNWYYLKPVNPNRACRELGTHMEGLSQLVRDARTMLIRNS